MAFVLCLGSLFLALTSPKDAYAIDFNPAGKAILMAIGTEACVDSMVSIAWWLKASRLKVNISKILSPKYY
jgi:hypothetical protein